MVEAYLILALINLLLGVSIAGVALCRLTHMPEGTCFIKAAPYALMLTAGLVSASSPWLGQWPHIGHVFVSFCVLVYVIASKSRFQNGV